MSQQGSGPDAGCADFSELNRHFENSDDGAGASFHEANSATTDSGAPEMGPTAGDSGAGETRSAWKPGDPYPKLREEDFDTPLEKELRLLLRSRKISRADAETLVNAGMTVDSLTRDPISLHNLAEYVRRKAVPQPRWIMISGLPPEVAPHPDDRRRRVRELWRAAVLFIRGALKCHELEQADENVEQEIKDERSVHWDPISNVTYHLQIAQSKLSGFCREQTGSNLVQTIDNVRAEGLKGKMRTRIRALVAEMRKGKVQGGKGSRGQSCGGRSERLTGQGGGEGLPPEGGTTNEVGAQCAINVTKNGGDGALDKWVVWRELRKSRRGPEWDRNSWAQSLGFANYRRMYRACTVKWKMAPHQLEMMLIEEALRLGTEEPDPPSEYKVWTLEEIRRAVNEVRNYPMMQ